MFRVFVIALVAVFLLQGCAKDVIPATSTATSNMPGTIAADAQ